MNGLREAPQAELCGFSADLARETRPLNGPQLSVPVSLHLLPLRFSWKLDLWSFPTSIASRLFSLFSPFFYLLCMLFRIQPNHPFYLHTPYRQHTFNWRAESQMIVPLKPGPAVVTTIISPITLLYRGISTESPPPSRAGR